MRDQSWISVSIVSGTSGAPFARNKPPATKKEERMPDISSAQALEGVRLVVSVGVLVFFLWVFRSDRRLS
jgi:hypothetical protein